MVLPLRHTTTIWEKSKHSFAGKMGQVAKWVGTQIGQHRARHLAIALDGWSGSSWAFIFPFLSTLMVTKCSEQENRTSLQSSWVYIPRLLLAPSWQKCDVFSWWDTWFEMKQCCLRTSPAGSTAKESACNAEAVGDTGSIPGLGRSPGGRHGYPLQYPCLENPVDRGAWWATVHGVSESWTRLKQLSMHTYKCGLKLAMRWGPHTTSLTSRWEPWFLLLGLRICSTSPNTIRALVEIML